MNEGGDVRDNLSLSVEMLADEVTSMEGLRLAMARTGSTAGLVTELRARVAFWNRAAKVQQRV